MDELVQLVELLQTELHSGSGLVESLDVKWVDPKGKDHVVVEARRRNVVVEVDWTRRSSFKLRLVAPGTAYHEAVPDGPSAQAAMSKIITLLQGD